MDIFKTKQFQRSLLIFISAFTLIFHKIIETYILLPILIPFFVIYTTYYFYHQKQYNLLTITTTLYLSVIIAVKLYLQKPV